MIKRIILSILTPFILSAVSLCVSSGALNNSFLGPVSIIATAMLVGIMDYCIIMLKGENKKSGIALVVIGLVELSILFLMFTPLSGYLATLYWLYPPNMALYSTHAFFVFLVGIHQIRVS